MRQFASFTSHSAQTPGHQPFATAADGRTLRIGWAVASLVRRGARAYAKRLRCGTTRPLPNPAGTGPRPGHSAFGGRAHGLRLDSLSRAGSLAVRAVLPLHPAGPAGRQSRAARSSGSGRSPLRREELPCWRRSCCGHGAVPGIASARSMPRIQLQRIRSQRRSERPA